MFTIDPRASAERSVELELEGRVKPSVFFTRTPPSHNSAGPVPLRTKARTYGMQPWPHYCLYGAEKSTLPGPREGSSILNVYLVVVTAAVDPCVKSSSVFVYIS